MTIPATVALAFAAVAAVFYVVNRGYLPAPALDSDAATDHRPAVSVLIPARDEQKGIRETLQRVLKSREVLLEVIVLDDHSADHTAAIVEEMARADARLRLVPGAVLPSGWCGKQHACRQLAASATNDEFVFLDADVRVEPDAILRAVMMRRHRKLDLLSGFPHQVTETFGEQLLLPLINYILLCYLPFWVMRGSTRLSASAGCGQFLITHRAAYQKMGGHAAIRSSLHDGVTLPRAYRRHQLMTDVFDASDVAQVRMYHGFSETWNGLSKNAVEGVANSRLILPVTVLMFGAHILPFVLLGLSVSGLVSVAATAMAAAAAVLSLLPRFSVARKYDGAWLAAWLHPLTITLFLTIQWTSWVRHLAGRQSQWRGRTYFAPRESTS